MTDTLLISQFADATVYLTRANFTEKELLEFPKKLIEEQKLKNVGFVLNGLGSEKPMVMVIVMVILMAISMDTIMGTDMGMILVLKSNP